MGIVNPDEQAIVTIFGFVLFMTALLILALFASVLIALGQDFVDWMRRKPVNQEPREGLIALMYSVNQLKTRAEARMLAVTLTPDKSLLEGTVYWKASLGEVSTGLHPTLDGAVENLEKITR